MAITSWNDGEGVARWRRCDRLGHRWTYWINDSTGLEQWFQQKERDWFIERPVGTRDWIIVVRPDSDHKDAVGDYKSVRAGPFRTLKAAMQTYVVMDRTLPLNVDEDDD